MQNHVVVGVVGIRIFDTTQQFGEIRNIEHTPTSYCKPKHTYTTQ